jgi:hypothetical protein
VSDQANSSESSSDPAAAASPDPAATGETSAGGAPAANPDSAATGETSAGGAPAVNPDPAATGETSAGGAPGVPLGPGPAAVTGTTPPLRPSNIVIGLCLAVIGVVIVAVITLFTPTPTRDQDIPYLLEPLEKQLDTHLRYKAPRLDERKDWRSDFATEQFIWRNEISRIMLGNPEAKPIENKRDYLLYLADSYFKDEPHFEEAKASYLTATVTKRIPHENAYDYSDDELWRRIAYCDIRLGLYDEAETWLKKALKINEDAAKLKPDTILTDRRNRILDNLAENYSRKGQPKLAEELVNQRLREMSQPDIDNCVEVSVLYDMALAKQNEGDLKQAEHLYKLSRRAVWITTAL